MTLYCQDGTLEIDNNIAENALRCVILGRKKFLIAGSDSGGERAAAMYTLIDTYALNDIDPRAYPDFVPAYIADHKNRSHRRASLWHVADKVCSPASTPTSFT